MQDWHFRLVGAVGGAAIYLLVALCAGRGIRAGLWVAVVMPVLPLLAIAAWLGGLGALAPSRAMLAIWVLQVWAAIAAGGALRAAPPSLPVCGDDP